MKPITATARPRVRPATVVIALTAAAAAGWIATAEATHFEHARAALIIAFVAGAIISVATWISERYADHLAAIAAELAANNERWEKKYDTAYIHGYLDHVQGGPPANWI